uniref:Secreted protein n=1 Tax=Sander lucioperca TaxID=283035 RepID=A0A8C9YEW1_SANLU
MAFQWIPLPPSIACVALLGQTSANYTHSFPASCNFIHTNEPYITALRFVNLLANFPVQPKSSVFIQTFPRASLRQKSTLKTSNSLV